MEQILMNLKILLPYKVLSEIKEVKSMTVETSAGSYGILPHRLDFAAAVVPGILSYETETGVPHYVAVDEGLAIKAGTEVLVSVRNAVSGTDLGKLHELIEKEFVNMDEKEKNVRSVMSKMETGLMQSLIKLNAE